MLIKLIHTNGNIDDIELSDDELLVIDKYTSLLSIDRLSGEIISITEFTHLKELIISYD